MRITPTCALLVLFSHSAAFSQVGEPSPDAPPKSREITIPLVDLASDVSRQVIVDREAGQYLGHPTTLLLEDGKTILCVYPKGHGRGPITYKRSDDGGLTWSDRLSTPDNWSTSKETPTLHRVISPDGTRRIILWSGLYPARIAVSEDDGKSWSPLKPAGDWGGIVVMSSLVPTGQPGTYRAFFHDDGRFFQDSNQAQDPRVFTLYQTRSTGGGLNWENPEPILARPDLHLCEPGAVFSPDGSELALLLRENSRTRNSYIIFSSDSGATWTNPVELPASLTGDRHTAKYSPDGRLVISFRDMAHESPTRGDWVAWVGTYEQLRSGDEGDFRVRLMDNTHGADCAYPGVEVLPDGTFVATTYGHWTAGEAPYVVAVRFQLDELDELAEKASATESLKAK
ncbi:hypothetical protein KOR42_49030 [Thalassoglobus neptunius]|uniref:Sialidase domain-containing protein n=1 Tax=Thalassoglobus neptunius TaxID=1938619 RepID=A0A5C5VRB2_9PLAN|nr:sialidase family protein [Thalassoglobus neptunius]TWT40700.1 hypothetical protein KOR42_49030 [Thalassoglobus neptunius]